MIDIIKIHKQANLLSREDFTKWMNQDVRIPSHRIGSLYPSPINTLKIIEDVKIKMMEMYGVQMSELRKHNRRADMAMLRHSVCYILKTVYKMSFNSVAQFVDRDRTSVLHSVTVIENMHKKDPIYMKFNKFIEYDYLSGNSLDIE